MCVSLKLKSKDQKSYVIQKMIRSDASAVPTSRRRFPAYVPQEEGLDGHYNNIVAMMGNITVATSWMQDCSGGQTFVQLTAIWQGKSRDFPLLCTRHYPEQKGRIKSFMRAGEYKQTNKNI